MDEQEQRIVPADSERIERSLSAAIAQGLAVGTATGVANQVAGKLLNRPPKEQAPKVELPPGVERD